MGATPADAANLNPDTHGFPGVEQRPDPVVGEVSEPERDSFHSLHEVVQAYLELDAWDRAGSGL